jgi:acetolactate synthase-1/2/3 large subunit
MYDQAGMIREIVKWDYELRNAEQLTTVVDRALAIAATEPRGPVYLSLPREVIAAPLSDLDHPSPSRLAAAAPPAPDANAIAAAARMLAQATRPLIVTANAGRDAAAFAAADAVHRAFCHTGRVASAALSLAAVIPSHESRFRPGATGAKRRCDSRARERRPLDSEPAAPRPDCKVIQCGLDPLFARYPIRGFPCDVAITGSAVATLAALTAALADALDAESIALRRRWIKDERETLTGAWKTARESAAARPRSILPG